VAPVLCQMLSQLSSGIQVRIVVSQESNDLASLLEYTTKQKHLMTALGQILLIDADLIRPEHPGFLVDGRS
jgi:hypothetical protein